MKFSKVGLTNGDIELKDQEDKSIFNKHLDEIIYFFQVTRYDVIVIEDLDRFNDAEIFTKLREVNSLINNSQQVGRQVKFVYAVRDDMFKDKDRAKFFDFIIPIIPVINTSNAGDKLGEKLKSLALEQPISDKFLNTITLYIHDMRLLINIINEFKIYLKQIGAKLDPEKLLAIIVYKNIYPEEFAKLHNQEGDVFDIINSKRQYIELELERKNAELIELQERLEVLRGMQFRNIQELRSVYISAILAQFPNFSNIRIGNIDKTIKVLLTDVGFNDLKKQGQIQARYHRPQYGDLDTTYIDKSFKIIEKEVDPEYTYEQRVKQFEDLTNQEMASIRNRIAAINKLKANIHGYTIADIINNDESYKIPENLASKPLLTFLISESFIDEHYPTYISFFIEGSLSQADMDFVIAVSQKKPLKYSHELRNIQTIATKWLSISNYGQRAILNINFIDWLVQQTVMKAEIDSLIDQLEYVSDIAKSFIFTYLEEGNAKDIFVRLLCDRWPNFWDLVYEDATLDDAIFDQYLTLILKNVPVDGIVKMNTTTKLSKYIELKADFLEFIAPLRINGVINEILKALNIKFDKIQHWNEATEVFNYIYKQNHYKLSPGNIKVIFQTYPDLFINLTEQQLMSANYSVLMASTALELKQYIENDINKYVVKVLLSVATNTDESATSLKELLNNRNLKDELKNELIERQINKIPQLKGIPESYYAHLLEYNKAASTWENIYIYFLAIGLNKVLIDFLNLTDNCNCLVKDEWHGMISNEIEKPHQAFEMLLLTCNELIIKTYKVIVDQAYYVYDEELAIDDLSPEKVEYLIESGVYGFSETNLAALDRNHHELVVTYLLIHDRLYFELPSPLLLRDSEYVEIMQHPVLTIESKFEFLVLLSADYIQGRTNLADKVGAFMLANTSVSTSFGVPFLTSLIRSISIVDLQMTLIIRLNELPLADLLELIESLPRPYAELTQKSRKPIFFDKSDLNERFLIYLGKRLDHIISSVKPDYKKNKLRVNFKV